MSPEEYKILANEVSLAMELVFDNPTSFNKARYNSIQVAWNKIFDAINNESNKLELNKKAEALKQAFIYFRAIIFFIENRELSEFSKTIFDIRKFFSGLTLDNFITDKSTAEFIALTFGALKSKPDEAISNAEKQFQEISESAANEAKQQTQNQSTVQEPKVVAANVPQPLGVTPSYVAPPPPTTKKKAAPAPTPQPEVPYFKLYSSAPSETKQSATQTKPKTLVIFDWDGTIRCENSQNNINGVCMGIFNIFNLIIAGNITEPTKQSYLDSITSFHTQILAQTDHQYTMSDQEKTSYLAALDYAVKIIQAEKPPISPDIIKDKIKKDLKFQALATQHLMLNGGDASIKALNNLFHDPDKMVVIETNTETEIINNMRQFLVAKGILTLEQAARQCIVHTNAKIDNKQALHIISMMKHYDPKDDERFTKCVYFEDNKKYINATIEMKFDDDLPGQVKQALEEADNKKYAMDGMKKAHPEWFEASTDQASDEKIFADKINDYIAEVIAHAKKVQYQCVHMTRSSTDPFPTGKNPFTDVITTTQPTIALKTQTQSSTQTIKQPSSPIPQTNVKTDKVKTTKIPDSNNNIKKSMPTIKLMLTTLPTTSNIQLESLANTPDALTQEHDKFREALSDITITIIEVYSQETKEDTTPKLVSLTQSKEELNKYVKALNKKSEGDEPLKKVAAQITNLTIQLLFNPTKKNIAPFAKEVAKAVAALNKKQAELINADIKNLVRATKNFVQYAEESQKHKNNIDYQYLLFNKNLKNMYEKNYKKPSAQKNIKKLFDFAKLKSDLDLVIKNLKDYAQKNPALIPLVIALINLTSQLLQNPNKENLSHYESLLKDLSKNDKNMASHDTAKDLITQLATSVRVFAEAANAIDNNVLQTAHPQSDALQLSHATLFSHTAFHALPTKDHGTKKEPEKLKRKIIIAISDIDGTFLIQQKNKSDEKEEIKPNKFNPFYPQAFKDNDVTDMAFATSVALPQGVYGEYKYADPEQDDPITRAAIPEHLTKIGFRQLPTITQLDYGFRKVDSSHRLYWDTYVKSFYEDARVLYKRTRQQLKERGANVEELSATITTVNDTITKTDSYAKALAVENESVAMEHWLILDQKDPKNNKSSVDELFDELKINDEDQRINLKKIIQNAFINIIKNGRDFKKDAEIQSLISKKTKIRSDLIKKMKSNPTTGQEFQKQFLDEEIAQLNKDRNNLFELVVTEELQTTLPISLPQEAREKIIQFLTKNIDNKEQRKRRDEKINNKFHMAEQLFNGEFARHVSNLIGEDVELEFIFIDDRPENLQGYKDAHQASSAKDQPAGAILALPAEDRDAITDSTANNRHQYYHQRIHSHLMQSMHFEATRLYTLLDCIIEVAKSIYGSSDPKQKPSDELMAIGNLKSALWARIDEFTGGGTNNPNYNVSPKLASELINLTIKLLQNPDTKNRQEYQKIITEKMLPQYQGREFEKGKELRTFNDVVKKIMNAAIQLATAVDSMKEERNLQVTPIMPLTSHTSHK